MNARKYAWLILHAEIRRRCGADEGLDFHPQLENQGVLMRNAREEGVSELDIILELAGFGATFAAMYACEVIAVDDDAPNVLHVIAPPNLLGVAKEIEQRVLAEPDEEDEHS